LLLLSFFLLLLPLFLLLLILLTLFFRFLLLLNGLANSVWVSVDLEAYLIILEVVEYTLSHLLDGMMLFVHELGVLGFPFKFRSSVLHTFFKVESVFHKHVLADISGELLGPVQFDSKIYWFPKHIVRLIW